MGTQTTETVKGWKVFDKDLKCRNFQFKVGETFVEKGNPSLCHNGFHFHTHSSHLFNYYNFSTDNRVCEIEAHGYVENGDDKSCCCTIKIVRELTWDEVLRLINTGSGNTGKNNTGYMNTGDRNTGYRNTGDMNTGDRNTGDRNTGDRNTGDMNTGDMNTGDRNTGYMNTGDMNTTDFSAGIFNTVEQPTAIFNGAATVMMSEFRNTGQYRALFSSSFTLVEWIYESNMTDQEKIDNPKFYVAEGYLKKRSFKEACELWWKNMSEENKTLVKSIPGFTTSIFTEVTGIKL